MKPNTNIILSPDETLNLGLAVQELHAMFGPGDTYLFGSRARGTTHDRSDMDVLHVPRARTAPACGFVQALDQVEVNVASRGGMIPLGIQIIPAHKFEDEMFETPFMKGAMKDMQDAKGIVVESLARLPDARLIREKLAAGRPAELLPLYPPVEPDRPRDARRVPDRDR